MTQDSTYNGWKNRATWNIALWLNNDEPMYRSMVALAKDAAKHNVVVGPLAAKHFCQDTFGRATPDGDRLSAKVDWKAIADLINECAD
jgi:hypothetical protein